VIRPLLKDDALLSDVRAAADDDPCRLHLWWLGQSGFLVQWIGRHLLIDPYLSDSLTKKYAATDKPHVRMTERVVDPRRLDMIDVATSSHNHTDHLDADTLVPLLDVNPDLQLVVSEANRSFAAERLGVDPARLLGCDAGSEVEAAGFKIAGVPAAHEELERDEAGRHRFLGYVISCGPLKIYHSGDTIRYEGMVDWLRPHCVDIAMLPINGRARQRRVAGNLWGREAAQLAHDIGAAVAIPCHYDMFEFNTATPDELVATADSLGQRIAVLQCGERFSWEDGLHYGG